MISRPQPKSKVENMESFERLIRLCKKSLELDPWVKERGMKGYSEEIIEEAKEALAEAEDDNYYNLKYELGDILYDWIHMVLLAEEKKVFTMDEIIRCTIEKYNRRKPYLRKNRKVSREAAISAWKDAKKREKEMVEIYDDDEKPIGVVHKSEAISRNLLRKSVQAYIIDHEGKILIHRRSEDKILYPGDWDVSVRGWVMAGESTDDAIRREIKEEIGLMTEPEFIVKYRFKIDESNDISYVYRARTDKEINFDKSEIAEIAWVFPEEILDGKVKELGVWVDLEIKEIWDKVFDDPKILKKISG